MVPDRRVAQIEFWTFLTRPYTCRTRKYRWFIFKIGLNFIQPKIFLMKWSTSLQGERVVEVVYSEENELSEEDDWKELPDKQIETKAIVGQIMQEAEEYSKNSLAKVVSAKATREAEETREESSGRPPQVKWESCLRGLDDESQQLWLEIQTAPETTLGADVQTPDPAEIAALDNDNRHVAKIALGGREYTALIDPGATCSVVLPRVVEEIGAKVEEKAGWIQGLDGKRSNG
ncbi:unnamed protein product [Trichogramma brassicae]|uniref:Uncharacterized protein n=1 Tax=Trichogramma brassicae TaxID=86971 RepID=A0A6H5IJP0_9HYME|nr:unnamed protein product [Trichogramma brassicae]